ncbi:MAG: MFS transporter [Candidatus Fischerbacteria bacterium RBG_13_37_8]|uniref:MFS transporter n=1 Tax=Candidatus Fischerbacteria bacterium RBG_13_37_8 TaxID=1817863 RepID=A0A1F5VGP3_9BACT|nr:MAG: MFS transporter [Candidatus Fischerbacteria bacterium RBG_13_37_8]
MNEQTNVKTKHPTAMYLLALTASTERFSYYGMRAFLILYMVNAANSQLGGMGWSDDLSGKVYGIFTGLCYLFPLLGGYLADRILGERKSVLIGAILIMLGHFTCAIDDAIIPLIAGLTLLIIGNGFFKTPILTMVGDLYEQGDKRRDSAFTIYYMLFNGGVFFAPILCGYLGVTYGYRYGFIAAGIGMFLGIIFYLFSAKKYLGQMGLVPKHKLQQKTDKKKTPLTKVEKDRIAVIFVLLFFVTFFWAGYEQAGSSFNLYTERFIDRVIAGWEIPTEWFQSVNPLFVVLLSPIFAWLWPWLEKRKKNPSTPVKMAIGLLILGAGFLFMVGAVFQRGGNLTDTTIKASLFWLLATYFFHTVGEICLSPIGLSMITKLAPARLGSFFMGIWFLSNFLANVISGFLVGYVAKLGAGTVFGAIGIFIILLGIIVFFISRRLLDFMHGRD